MGNCATGSTVLVSELVPPKGREGGIKKGPVSIHTRASLAKNWHPFAIICGAVGGYEENGANPWRGGKSYTGRCTGETVHQALY